MCASGSVCRHTVVNPCLCEPGLACCEACGAEQWLCLPPDPSGACAGRSYCDCTGDCVPLVDLTPGCICPCDDPFHCGGPACDCDCGGAHYLGCAIVGVCPSTEIQCAPGLHAEIISGCPTCAIAH